jgi:hypothetical protein
LKGTALEQFLATHPANELLLSLRRFTTQEIDQNLSEYLADDLRESLKPSFRTAVRVALFFDTFEALGAGLPNMEHQLAREQWVQDLAGNFDFALTVIAGQNRLTWDDADPRWNDPEHLQQHMVGGLSDHDARIFLERCAIENSALQDAILFTAHDADDNGKHCFSLALCADIVLTERRAMGHDPAPESLRFRPQDWEALARRFLKSLDSEAERRWIARLAITPRFDEPAARAAFSKEHSAAQDAAWHTLLDYSFLQLTAGRSGWYISSTLTGESLVEGNQGVAGRGAKTGEIGICPIIRSYVCGTGCAAPVFFETFRLFDEPDARIAEKPVSQLPCTRGAKGSTIHHAGVG